MEQTKVNVLEKGPVIVEGNLKITYSNGTIEEKNGKIAICRCGYSQNKPFCDGAHRDCPVTDKL